MSTHFYKYILPCLMLASCTAAKSQPASVSVYTAGSQKLKQKAVVLQKKLEKAKRTLSEEEQAIDKLRSQLCDAELNAIESKVDVFEKKWKSDPSRLMQSPRHDISNLFIEDREILTRIIQVGPDTMRAQILLDRILQMITQISDFVPSALN